MFLRKLTTLVVLPLRYSVPGVLLLSTAAVALGVYLQNVRLADDQVERDALADLTQDATSFQRSFENLFSSAAAEQVQQELAEQRAAPNSAFAAVADESNNIIASGYGRDVGRQLQSCFNEQIARQHGLDVDGLLKKIQQHRVGTVSLATDGDFVMAVYPVLLGLTPGQVRSERYGALVIVRDLHMQKRQAQRAITRSVVGFEFPM